MKSDNVHVQLRERERHWKNQSTWCILHCVFCIREIFRLYIDFRNQTYRLLWLYWNIELFHFCLSHLLVSVNYKYNHCNIRRKWQVNFVHIFRQHLLTILRSIMAYLQSKLEPMGIGVAIEILWEGVRHHDPLNLFLLRTFNKDYFVTKFADLLFQLYDVSSFQPSKFSFFSANVYREMLPNFKLHSSYWFFSQIFPLKFWLSIYSTEKIGFPNLLSFWISFQFNKILLSIFVCKYRTYSIKLIQLKKPAKNYVFSRAI